MIFTFCLWRIDLDDPYGDEVAAGFTRADRDTLASLRLGRWAVLWGTDSREKSAARTPDTTTEEKP